MKKKFTIKKPYRATFGFPCAPWVSDRPRKISTRLEVPIFAVMEHITDIGSTCLEVEMATPEGEEALRDHLKEVHGPGKKLNPDNTYDAEAAQLALQYASWTGQDEVTITLPGPSRNSLETLVTSSITDTMKEQFQELIQAIRELNAKSLDEARMRGRREATNNIASAMGMTTWQLIALINKRRRSTTRKVMKEDPSVSKEVENPEGNSERRDPEELFPGYFETFDP